MMREKKCKCYYPECNQMAKIKLVLKLKDDSLISFPFCKAHNKLMRTVQKDVSYKGPIDIVKLMAYIINCSKSQ